MSSRRGFLKGLVVGSGAAVGLAATDCLVRLASPAEVEQLAIADPVVLLQPSADSVHHDLIGRVMFMQDPRGHFLPVGALASIVYQHEMHSVSGWGDMVETKALGILRAEGRVVFSGPVSVQVRA